MTDVSDTGTEPRPEAVQNAPGDDFAAKLAIHARGGVNPKQADTTFHVRSVEDYDRVPRGRAYMDPQGNKRFKPIQDKSDYQTIPEGAEYADPEGNIRTKPKYEGIDFTPQTLFDMQHSDKGRRMALEKFY